jgi:hypothetical protein
MANVQQSIRRVIDAFGGLHVACKVTQKESSEDIAARLQEYKDRAHALEVALAAIRERVESTRAA